MISRSDVINRNVIKNKVFSKFVWKLVVLATDLKKFANSSLYTGFTTICCDFSSICFDHHPH